MRLDERAHELGLERGDVAVQYEHVAGRARECSVRGAHRVAGSERSLLHRDLEPVERRGSVGRRDDDDAPDARALCGADHPVDHPAAEQRVQVLRRPALHARAEAAGHYDCCEIVRQCGVS